MAGWYGKIRIVQVLVSEIVLVNMGTMKQIAYQILALLADGKFHSGERLAKTLGVSRTTIWQAIKQLLAMDIDIQVVRSHGYRISDGLELLSETKIHQAMDVIAKAHISQFAILPSVNSTNQYLLDNAELPSGTVCLAEMQTAGRGRRDRKWQSPFGRNIYLSMVWNFAEDASILSGLSLAVGIAVVKTLERYGISGAELKWPNDVIYQQSKLAGTLIEFTGKLKDACRVVIGIGMNVHLPEKVKEQIPYPSIDLETIIGPGQRISRNQLIGLLLSELIALLSRFQTQGFEAYMQEWKSLDSLLGKHVVLQKITGDIEGTVEGVDVNGCLLLRSDDGMLYRFMSGEVSVSR